MIMDTQPFRQMRAIVGSLGLWIFRGVCRAGQRVDGRQ